MNTSLTPSFTKLITRIAFIAVCVLLYSAQAWASTFTSTGSGSWSAPATWTITNGSGTIPGANDAVVILENHSVTITDPATINSLTVTGNLIVSIPNGILTTNDVAENPSATTGTVTITTGDLRVKDIFNLTNLLITIDGASSSVTFGGEKDYIRTTEYFHINNGGKLIMENLGKGQKPRRQYSNLNLGDILFPVGTTDGTSYSYTPVYINNRDSRPATVNATFAVTVTDGVYSNGSDGSKYGFNVVNRTWSVSVLFGDAEAEVYLQWNQPNELHNFILANSMVAVYEGGVWDQNLPTYFNAATRVASLAGFTNIATTPPTNPPTPSPARTFPLMSIQGSGLIPLAVELVSFNAVKKNNEVVLTWETASEKNSRGFEVQSSTDGKNYEALDFVPSHNGNATYNQRYAYTDKAANKEGLVYYRLKQEDMDGTVSFYNAKVVDLGRFNNVASVYPNPFQEAFKVNMEASSAETAQVMVTDITGKILYTAEHNLAKGANTIDIALNNQTAGLYLLKVTTGNQTYTNRLVKQ